MSAATRRSATAVLLLAGLQLGACTEPEPELRGQYLATTFKITPSGGSEIDALAGGATLSITITVTQTTTGSLFLPASVTGEGSDFTASMAGTATRVGAFVEFH